MKVIDSMPEEEFLKSVLDRSGIKPGEVGGMQPLILAYVGDAVFEVYVRTYLAGCGPSNVNKLHRLSVEYVKACAQADILRRIAGTLSPEEQDIVRRGRNAKSGTIPKNADVAEYKHATGFETLIGYLYLKGDFERLLQVLKLAVA